MEENYEGKEFIFEELKIIRRSKAKLYYESKFNIKNSIYIIQKTLTYRAFWGKKKSEWSFLKINKYINIFFWFAKYDARTTYVFFIDYFFAFL